jgi:hypothetical protein
MRVLCLPPPTQNIKQINRMALDEAPAKIAALSRTRTVNVTFQKRAQNAGVSGGLAAASPA